jgi:hypothetical protein
LESGVGKKAKQKKSASMAVKVERSVKPPARMPYALNEETRNGLYKSVGFKMRWRFVHWISWHGANCNVVGEAGATGRGPA